MPRRSTKRAAISQETFLKMIFAVMVVAGLFWLMPQLFEDAGQSYSESACRASVLLRGTASYDGAHVSAERITPLACGSRDLGELEGDKDKQRETISDHAATCWWMFARGRIDNVFGVEGNKEGCHICYRFRPNEEGSMNGSNLIDYMLNETYEPSALRGGGTKYFIGDGIELENLPPASENKSSINLASYDAPSIGGNLSEGGGSFVNDATGLVSSGQRTDITNAFVKIIQASNVSGRVIIADHIESHSRQEAQDAMEDLKLTRKGNHTKGFLITVSLADRTVRLDAGRDITNYFGELSIAEMLSPYQQMSQESDVGEATVRTIESIRDRIKEEESRPYKTSSYFGYLASGQSIPMVTQNISPSRTYAIAFVSPGNDMNWFNGVGNVIMETPQAAAGGAGGTAAGGALTAGAYSLGLVTGPIGLGVAAAGTVVLASQTADFASDADDASYKYWNAVWGDVEKDTINSLLIAPNDEIAGMCDD